MALPAKVRETVEKEIDRLERTSTQSPEQSWIRTWLDRVLDLPWGKTTSDNLDLVAREVLDADHHGLDDVKDRIVEFLAVRKLRHERWASTTCRPTDGRASPGRAGGRQVATPQGGGAIVTLVGPRVSARRRSARASLVPWVAASCAWPSAASATRPRSAATAAPTWAASPAASPVPSPRRGR